MRATLVTTPNQSSRHGHEIKMVVIHGDAGKTDKGTVEHIRRDDSDVSYHYLIGRDGTVYQFVDEAEKAWHAGKSEWPGCTEGKVPSVNWTSIGVSFANDGTGKEPFLPVQYKVGGELVASICRRYNIPTHLIRGHDEVSPGRKTDPWPHFDWGQFYRWFWHYLGDPNE